MWPWILSLIFRLQCVFIVWPWKHSIWLGRTSTESQLIEKKLFRVCLWKILYLPTERRVWKREGCCSLQRRRNYVSMKNMFLVISFTLRTKVLMSSFCPQGCTVFLILCYNDVKLLSNITNQNAWKLITDRY